VRVYTLRDNRRRRRDGLKKTGSRRPRKDMEFATPWLVVASALLLLLAAVAGVLRRAWSPALLASAAAAFLFAGAQPRLGGESGNVGHAAVLDVSDSMAARDAAAALDSALAQANLPRGHELLRFELSDALRPAGSPGGAGTEYSRLVDLRADERVSGEVILASDGRGSLAELLDAVDPRRLILLRLPAPDQPDASIVSFSGPTAVAEGGTALLRAVIHSDRDGEVRWRMLDGETEIASGTRQVSAGRDAGISAGYLPRRDGLVRVRLVLDMPGDREPRNDEASLAFYAGAKRVVLYCVPSGFPAGADALLAALRDDPVNEVRVAHRLPTSPRELDGVGLLFMNDIALHESGAQRESLSVIADWVMAGGNLMMLGADGAFGPGGYRGTAIEQIMPVRFRPEDAPPARTLLLLDISESMDLMLPGGITRLQRLREAARRLLDQCDPTDAVALAGFNIAVQTEIVYRRPDDPAQQRLLDSLRAGLGTDIHASLRQALATLDDADARQRLIVITDGEDHGGATQADWHSLGDTLASQGVRADIVLTTPDTPEWYAQLRGAPSVPEVHAFVAGTGGYDDLLETLDRAVAGGEDEWVSRARWEVPGVMTPLHLLAKAAPRDDPSVEPMLDAIPPGQAQPEYPLLSVRQLIGRTAALNTRSWGDERQAEFWGDHAFQEWLSKALTFVAANAGRQLFQLNVLDEGAELVWIGAFEAPGRDLRAADRPLRLLEPGRWMLSELPPGDELLVFDQDLLLQRLPLPQPVPSELQRTGDDETFFSLAEQAGVRVVRSLNAWQPRRMDAPRREAVDITWLPALLALALLIAGFAMRRR
jgi:hypothetical protein